MSWFKNILNFIKSIFGFAPSKDDDTATVPPGGTITTAAAPPTSNTMGPPAPDVTVQPGPETQTTSEPVVITKGKVKFYRPGKNEVKAFEDYQNAQSAVHADESRYAAIRQQMRARIYAEPWQGYDNPGLTPSAERLRNIDAAVQNAIALERSGLPTASRIIEDSYHTGVGEYHENFEDKLARSTDVVRSVDAKFVNDGKPSILKGAPSAPTGPAPDITTYLMGKYQGTGLEISPEQAVSQDPVTGRLTIDLSQLPPNAKVAIRKSDRSDFYTMHIQPESLGKDQKHDSFEIQIEENGTKRGLTLNEIESAIFVGGTSGENRISAHGQMSTPLSLDVRTHGARVIAYGVNNNGVLNGILEPDSSVHERIKPVSTQPDPRDKQIQFLINKNAKLGEELAGQRREEWHKNNPPPPAPPPQRIPVGIPRGLPGYRSDASDRNSISPPITMARMSWKDEPHRDDHTPSSPRRGLVRKPQGRENS